MKFLCICNAGNNRSAALATALKHLNGDYIHQDIPDSVTIEAVAIGVHRCTKDTLQYFISWADYVIVITEVQEAVEQLQQLIPPAKYIRWDIGYDRWVPKFNNELFSLAMTQAHMLKQRYVDDIEL